MGSPVPYDLALSLLTELTRTKHPLADVNCVDKALGCYPDNAKEGSTTVNK